MNYLKKFCLLATVPICLSASVAHAAEMETLSIKKQTSHYMNMGMQITRVAVGNKDIASIIQLPGSASEFLIVTKASAGSTALFVWTIDGTRHEYLIVVSPEDPGQAMLIEKAIGLPDVHVKMVGERILLTGTVENQYEKNYALQTARLFVNGSTESSLLVGSGFDMSLSTDSAKSSSGGRSEDVELAKSETNGTIIDLIQILYPTQIRLEAQIIEINSDDAKALGLQYGMNGSGGIFSFGEDYNRSHTSISESSSNGWSDSYSGSNSNSYGGSNSSSYSNSRSWASNENPYTDEYNYDYSSSSSGNGWDNSNSNSRNNGYSNSRNSSFSRSVTSAWNDLVRFGNNPVKWIGQHFSPINATITALVTKGKARILSRPSVTTLSGEQATIQIGGEIPYHTSSSNGPNTTFRPYGIILQFKPVVDSQNRINSAVHAEVSQPDGQTPDGQITIATRSADSVINLHSGSPIVIGGLIDSTERKSVSKIPLLGDIPIIGEFFKHTSRTRDKRELIIVVTPYIVESEELSRSPMSEPMRQWYEQEEAKRKAMEPHDFKEPEEEVLEIKEPEPERILPLANYPKDGKTTDRPFKK